MSAEKALMIVFLILPFGAALFPSRAERVGVFSGESLATLLRVILLLSFAREMLVLGGSISIRASLVEGYPLDLLLSLDPYKYGFLVVAEFCFLLAHWLLAFESRGRMIKILLGFAQGLASLLVVSENACSTGAFLFLSGAVFFYLVRFALPQREEQAVATISTRMYVLFFLLGLLTIAWGVEEFGRAGLVFGRGGASPIGLFLWMALVIVSIPMPPWSKWFSGVMELLPRGVSLSVVVFICSIALKFASLLSVSYPDLSWKHKLVFYLLGMLGCAFSLLRLFAADTKRRMAGCLPGFFLSLVLVSLGVSRTGLVLSAYFACIFVPVFTGLILCAWAMEIRGALPRLFAALLFALVWGLPGTPVYQIFSGIGARSLELGIGYTIVFGLLWFFYFNANIHIYRRILLLGEGGSPEDADPIASLAPRLFAGYGLFLMLLVIVVAQIAGRIL